MSPYAILGSRVGTAEAASLCERLTAWHDAMVVHERRIRTGRTIDACDDECPHVEARALWAEALATLGSVAGALGFLRSRATGASPTPRVRSTVASRAPDGEARTTRKGSEPWVVGVVRAAESTPLAQEPPEP